MAQKSILLTALASCLLVCGPLSAQENDGFDLSSQRSESQHVLMVPGQKLDHKGLIINPTPHSLTLDPDGTLDFSGGIRLTEKQGKFAEEIGRILPTGQKGVKLTTDFGPEAAAEAGVKAVSGAYALNIGKKGIAITGYDERGVFYGIQTLRQIAESPIVRTDRGRRLPYLEINDYPDLPLRGVVEGFYGTPWPHAVRLSLIDFYGRFKMNSYLYGPKDDPYHSSPNWRQPYPEKEAQNIRELVEACNRNYVDFVWAIHPGQDIKWNEEDYGNLVHKFQLMYDLGVRSFAIFFDDISGEGTNPVKQVELLNRLNREFVQAKGDVSPLVVCPTDYSKLWANPTPQGSLSIYGQTLDPSVAVFWTGDAVCSDLTPETMEWLNSRIRRPGYYWWNYPVTDYVRHIIMQGPVYGLDTTLTADEVYGFASNPMEHGEASKLALYGVADYTWNIAAYNPIDNWERGIAELVPEAKEAYRTFAIHSCDTETGYRRAESWETETFRIGDYTPEQYDALLKEFEKIERVPAEMEAKCANAELLRELRPWLAEFGKLGTRGRKALELVKLYEAGDDAALWSAYVQNLMSDEDRKAYNAHKSGTMKLQPFYELTMDDIRDALYAKIAGKKPAAYKAVGTFPNLQTVLGKLMFDNDSTTFYTSGVSQKAGSWIGADLGDVREVSEIDILQGRNSTDDVDYFDHAILEYSENGRTWLPLTDSLHKQYIVRWNGEPVKARYVRLRRLESSKTNWAAVRSFEVNPVRADRLGFRIETADSLAAKALYAFDEHPGTSVVSSGTFGFGIPANVSGYTLLLKPGPQGTPKLRQTDAEGAVLSETAIDAPLFRVKIAPGATKIELLGDMEIFEIIPE